MESPVICCPFQELLVRCMTDPLVDAAAVLHSDAARDLTEKEGRDVLAVRGLLACNLLAHALQLRHGVDFGVSR